MAAFGYLIVKEMKQFNSNRFMPFVLVLLPVVLMLFVPLLANMEIRNVRLMIVDHDRSTTSALLTDRIAQSEYFRFAGYCDTYSGAVDEMGMGHTDIIMEIPAGMERDIGRGEQVEIFIAANAVNSTKGSIGGGYLSSIITDFSEELAAGLYAPDAPVQASGQESSGAGAALSGDVIGGGATMPLTVSPQFRYNPHLVYKLFMVPAMMIVVIILIGGFFATMSIVSEKEAGTIEQINVTPVRKRDFISSKVVFYGILGLIAFTLAFLIGHFVYGLAPHGGLPELYVGAVLFLIFMAGFGLIISNYSDTLLQSVFLMLFFVLIFMLMSGIFTPVSSMETWAQYLTYFLPTTYFVNILRAVCLKGSQFSDLTFNYIMLSVFAVLINVIAIVTYKKQR